jgi:hypothetical protein
MRKTALWFSLLAVVSAAPLCADPSSMDELVVKNCQELMRMAETCQEDLKTGDTVLGSALEGGGIDRIKNYKLKKNALKKQIESVMKAIDIRGCIKSRP